MLMLVVFVFMLTANEQVYGHLAVFVELNVPFAESAS